MKLSRPLSSVLPSPKRSDLEPPRQNSHLSLKTSSCDPMTRLLSGLGYVFINEHEHSCITLATEVDMFKRINKWL